MASVFANNLRRIREERGVTKTAIARQLGITLTAYSFYEQGSTEPSILNIKKIADFLGVSVDELFTGIAEEQAAQQRDQMTLADLWGLGGFELTQQRDGYVRIEPPDTVTECFPLELKPAKLLKLTKKMYDVCKRRFGDDQSRFNVQFELQGRLVLNRLAAMRRVNPFDIYLNVDHFMPSEETPISILQYQSTSETQQKLKYAASFPVSSFDSWDR